MNESTKKGLQPRQSLPPDQKKRDDEDDALIADFIHRFSSDTHPTSIRTEGAKVLKNIDGKTTLTEQSPLFGLLTMHEFQSGILLSNSFLQPFKTFVTELSLSLQQEYDCQKASEKATAHLAAHSYARVLSIQMIINRYQEKQKNRLEVNYFALLSKELDRAEKHYYQALQTLRNLKQPPINFTVKTQQANFAHQMITNPQDAYEPK